MRFVATHDVTPENVVHALLLTRRWTDVILGALVVVVLAAMLWQVLSAFALYLRSAAGSPATLAEFLGFKGSTSNAVLAWASVLVTLGLPVLLFYSLRALAEARTRRGGRVA